MGQFETEINTLGYGAATPDLAAPGVEWRGQDTYISKDSIAGDFGAFDSPMPSKRATALISQASEAAVRALRPPRDKPQRGAYPEVKVVKSHGPLPSRAPRKPVAARL